MSGSRKWMIYTADDNQQYAVNIDESNGEVADFDDFTLASQDSNIQTKPDHVSMRYATVKDPSTGSSRKIYVGKPTSDIFSGIVSTLLLWVFAGGASGSSVPWSVVRLVGETINRSRPTPNDNGFTDSDWS